MSEISERLYAAISEKGYSYGELSKLTGIPKSAIQRYATGETEKIPIDRLEALADVLGVSSSFLMGWSKPSPLIIPKDFIQFFAEPAPQSELEKQISEACAILEEMPPDLRSRALAAIKALAQPPQSPDDRGGSD